MLRIAIIAALAGELKPLVRGWQHESRNGVEIWRWQHDEGEWVAVCAGAGVDAATRALAEIEKNGPVSLAISVGWAGALREELTSSKAYRVAGVIDARTGERFETADASVPRSQNRDLGHPVGESVQGHPDLWLVTSTTVADEREKQRFAVTYKAALVDMEASGIARLAQMRGIPFYCCKGVSDGFRDKLPDFNRFLSKNGQFMLARFILFILLRPGYWPALIRMGENSKRAARSIAESLLVLLDERGSLRKRNGYPNYKN
jgi:adenosylhomocysteine nucleosidase